MSPLPPYLTDAYLDDLIARALQEDVRDGDVTTLATVPETTMAMARFWAKNTGVLAGLYVAQRVFAAVDAGLRVSWDRADGDRIAAGTPFGTVQGAARSLLTAERLALNLMQRMSGIATATNAMVRKVGTHHAQILDTRKTVPGLRLLDKWAVLLGGGANHRIGLFDMILIKDNHVDAAGGIAQALSAAKRYRDAVDASLRIEVETRDLEEVSQVLNEGGADLILLDNMARVRDDGTLDTSMLAEAVKLIDGRVKTEASGNVTLDTVLAIAATGVDFISSGALTHSVDAFDISLKIDLE